MGRWKTCLLQVRCAQLSDVCPHVCSEETEHTTSCSDAIIAHVWRNYNSIIAHNLLSNYYVPGPRKELYKDYLF